MSKSSIPLAPYNLIASQAANLVRTDAAAIVEAVPACPVAVERGVIAA